MQIEIERNEARVALELLREAERQAGGPEGKHGAANSDINVVYLGIVHRLITKIDDAYIGSFQ